MEAFNAHAFAMTLALVGVVILIAGLLSGFIERSNLPQVAVFLALGVALGPHGLNLLTVTLESPLLRVVATLSLALVLFTDAVGLDIRAARRHSGLALIVLGPGTMLSFALIALAGWYLLGLPPAAAAVLGAALASTDPILLRGLLKRPDLPQSAAQALRLESGLNDVVLLPVVLVAMQFMERSAAAPAPDWTRLFVDLFLLGPGAGVLAGLIAVSTLDLVRRRIGVRRDYESLYSLGVAFTAFAAAEALGGSGFLAVFAAGLTIAALDVELCDCFLDYGSSTAELALLFTFVILGASLIWTGLAVATVAALTFALITILIRPVAFLLSFLRARIPRRDKLLIAWFGPRGLSSLLLVLLPVFAKIPGSETLFALCCLVVLVSIAAHGGSLMFLDHGLRLWQSRASRTETETAEEPDGDGDAELPRDGHSGEMAMEAGTSAASLDPSEAGIAPRAESAEEAAQAVGDAFITVEELRRLRQAGEPVVVVDVRTQRTYDESDLLAQGAIRLDPDRAVQQAQQKRLPHPSWVVAFCT